MILLFKRREAGNILKYHTHTILVSRYYQNNRKPNFINRNETDEDYGGKSLPQFLVPVPEFANRVYDK